MDAWMALGTIVAIIAVVLIGGALIAFLGNMIIRAIDGNKKSEKEVVEYANYKQLENTKSTQNEYNFEEINLAKAEQERLLANDAKEPDFAIDDDFDEDLDDELIEESNSEPIINDDSDDLDSLLNEISEEYIDEEKTKINENNTPKMSDTLQNYSIDNILNNQNEEDEEVEDLEEDEDLEEIEQPEEIEDEEEVVEEVVEDKTEELNIANETIEQLKAQLEELNKKLENANSIKPETSITTTEQECLDRLAILEERLKKAKADYKTNLKEYRPLKKVMKDMERYETKLRRKDAIVAKKKVALYGVNNYVDIDKEKAEKLENDIELLDGLRLSVSHCEEVINANKDRFPILEHTNNILEEQIAHIEEDIAATNETLRKICEQNGESSDNNQGENQGNE